MARSDTLFAGSIPQLYERHLVPLIFERYAADLAARVASLQPSRVLELACGTGVASRRLARALPRGASLLATDINQPMLDEAAAVSADASIAWRHADAMNLPFDDGSFDAVTCQFGVMFFPDRARAFSEARRVLRRGGHLMFSVWDRIEENEFADVVTEALARLWPEDPPRFLARVPHGYCDFATIAGDLAAGGFENAPKFDTIAERSRAESPQIPAIAYCQGTPLRNEIETRAASRLGEATNFAADAIRTRFGTGAVDGKIQAHVVSIRN